MEVKQVIENRRSIRNFIDKDIEREKLESILNAAISAPNARNDQNLFYVIVSDKTIKDKLLNTLNIKANYFNCNAILFSFEREDDYLNDLSNGGAIENAILQATDLGLGTCWVHSTVKVLNSDLGRKTLKNLLDLDKEYKASDTVAIGYYEIEKPEKKPRKYSYDKII